jgi:FkbM family methyltransferase
MFYSHIDCNNIPFETKIDELFKQKEYGFFIELGAHDGLFQSNTAFLEKMRNWKGILIEPSKKGHELCIKNRPNSICLNYACVSKEYSGSSIYGNFENNSPMASINGERKCDNHCDHLVEVSAATLESILDNNITNLNIDFLSLDAEGYELNILKGMNFQKYRPNYLLIEIYEKDYKDILEFLKDNEYSLISNFSNYSTATNPHWDGSHNDYLFIDNQI